MVFNVYLRLTSATWSLSTILSSFFSFNQHLLSIVKTPAAVPALKNAKVSYVLSLQGVNGPVGKLSSRGDCVMSVIYIKSLC